MRFIKKIIRERKDLFKLIYEFNHNIALCINFNHMLKFLDEKVARFLLSKRRGTHRLSSILEDRYGLKDDYYYDFEDPLKRLALVDQAALHRLMLYAGVAYCSEYISHVVSKKELDIIKDALGEDTYLFALKKAPFLVPHKPDLNLDEIKEGDLLEVILKSGQECLEVCFSDLPNSVTNRIQLKFSKHIEFDFQKKPSGELKSKTWNFLKMILTKEINRDLIPCFK